MDCGYLLLPCTVLVRHWHGKERKDPWFSGRTKNDYWFLPRVVLLVLRNSKRRKQPWLSILEISSPLNQKLEIDILPRFRPKAKKYISEPRCKKGIRGGPGRRDRPSSLFHEYRGSPGCFKFILLRSHNPRARLVGTFLVELIYRHPTTGTLHPARYTSPTCM